MKTVNVALKPGVSTRGVEGFPEFVSLPSDDPAWKVVKEGEPPPRRDFARSCSGALYLTDSYKPITPDELQFIKDKLPELYSSLFMHDESGWLGDQAPARATQKSPADLPVAQEQSVAPATPEPTSTEQDTIVTPAVSKKRKG